MAEEPIVLPITEILDLHTFRSEDVQDLLDDYFAACIENGIHSVRIIHGKGTGQLKRRVRALLSRHSRVLAYRDAPTEAGGWGATVVDLERRTS